MQVNPYEFDDNKYNEVSIALSSDDSVSSYIEDMWRAGGTRDDIVNEFMSIIDDTLNELERG